MALILIIIIIIGVSMLHLRPLLKASITSCCVMAAGDVFCQCITSRQRHEVIAAEDWNRVQTGRFAVVGLTLHGPFFYHGFQWLDRLKAPGPKLQQVGSGQE